MKVNAKENITIMTTNEYMTVSVEIKRRQVWECRDNKYDIERCSIEKNGVKVNMRKSALEKMFKIVEE